MDKRVVIIMAIRDFEESKITANLIAVKKKTNLTTPTLSKATKELMAAGLLRRKRKGRDVFYITTPKGKRWTDILKEANIIFKIFRG